MKAEELLQVVEDDTREYDRIRRENIDYDLKRENTSSSYLGEVGVLSQNINDGLRQIVLSEDKSK